MAEKPTKRKDKRMIQYCIDAVHFTEVLNRIPSEVTINKLLFEIGNPLGKLREDPGVKLKALGVNYIRRPHDRKEYNGSFEGISRSKMTQNVKEICKEVNVLISDVRVVGLHIEHKDVKAYFKRVKKDIRPDTTDQRKKLTLLGMESYEGEKISGLIAALSLDKYSCVYTPIDGIRIVCAKVT
jgi:hypothetical protein